MLMAHCGMSLLLGAKDYDWGMAVVQAAVEANPNNLLIVVRAGIAQPLLRQPRGCSHLLASSEPAEPRRSWRSFLADRNRVRAYDSRQLR